MKSLDRSSKRFLRERFVLEIRPLDVNDVFGHVELDRLRFGHQVELFDVVGGSSHAALSFDVIEDGVAYKVELGHAEVLASLFCRAATSKRLKESRSESKS